ncbi:MAG: hypothetical protein J7L64_04110 [Acidobacteria bacterium]|nr:hypothetical protein [Acidobacteriota bacterium]
MGNRTNSKRIYYLIKLFLIIFCLLLALPSYGQSLVSNVDGKIRVIILHYGKPRRDGFWHDQTVFFRDLMNKMDKDVAFVVVLGKDKKAEKAREILKPYAEVKLPDGTPRVKFLTVDVETNNFYPWARDGYLILADEKGNLTFLDVGFNEKPFPITNFDEVFENAKTLAGVIHRGGGNIRTTRSEMIIGMDTMLGITVPPRWYPYSEKNLYLMAKELKPKDVPLFRKKFTAYCKFIQRVLAPDKKLVIPGEDDFFARLEKGEFAFTKKTVRDTGAQASYHTDVYLGLGHIDERGKRVIFIADARLGAKVIERMTEEERRAIERKLPKILAQEGLTACDIPVTAEQIAKRFKWDKKKLLDLSLKRALEVAPRLDKAAKRMEELGYRVVRIPYLPNGLCTKREYGISFNYSNVLTEVYGNRKRVYMPEYGFPQMDDAAAEAYRNCGFEVVRIKGVVTQSLTWAQDNAGIDCLTSEIRFPVRWAKKYYRKDQ